MFVYCLFVCLLGLGNVHNSMVTAVLPRCYGDCCLVTVAGCAVYTRLHSDELVAMCTFNLVEPSGNKSLCYHEYKQIHPRSLPR